MIFNMNNILTITLLKLIKATWCSSPRVDIILAGCYWPTPVVNIRDVLKNVG